MSEDLGSALAGELKALAESWVKQAEALRSLAEEPGNLIDASRRYGRCDTFEDVALQVQNRLSRSRELGTSEVAWQNLADQWLELAEWSRTIAEKDDNRLLQAYRTGCASVFEDVAEKLRFALKLVLHD